MSGLLYVGTYTDSERSDGIYIVRMDESGALRVVGSIDAGANPSFLSIDPTGRVLYAVNEIEEYCGEKTGAVSAFAIEERSGALTRLNTQASEGGAPCYLSVDQSGRFLLAANYSGGTVAMFPVESNGKICKASSVAHLTRNAHCILTDPSNGFALCADLGADRVFVFHLDVDNELLRQVKGDQAVMRPGAGPRHLAFHPSLPSVFVANELDSTVASLHFDQEQGALSPLATHSTLPDGWTGASYPSDIHLAPDGEMLYVSNRGHNSIAAFSVETSTGALQLEQVVSTEGDWPRNFTLSPNGDWLLVANQRSNSVVVFERNQESGRLTVTRHRLEIPSPACIRFHL